MLCPCCGTKDAYIGFNKVECLSPECKFYKQVEEEKPKEGLKKEELTTLVGYPAVVDMSSKDVDEIVVGRRYGKSFLTGYIEKLQNLSVVITKPDPSAYSSAAQEQVLYDAYKARYERRIQKSERFAECYGGSVGESRKGLEKIDSYIGTLEKALEVSNKLLNKCSFYSLHKDNMCMYFSKANNQNGKTVVSVRNKKDAFIAHNVSIFLKNGTLVPFNSVYYSELDEYATEALFDSIQDAIAKLDLTGWE